MPDHNPFHGISDLFTEFGRIRETGSHGRDLGAEDRQRTHASAWVPTTDIFVQGDRLAIRIELAGVEPEDIDLRFANGVLTVSGSRSGGFDPPGELTFYVRERFYGEFRRSITLPEGTRRDQIHAAFDDGLVEIIVDGVGERSEATTRIELRDGSTAATTRSVS